jgi:CubicO group peptidase (beta-lactamase class C family)
VLRIAGDDDEPPITRATGVASLAFAVENTADTKFGVASISKLITGALVARLVDRGALGWGTRYAEIAGADWLPPAFDRSITIAQLLGHTSGFGDYFDEEDPDADYEAIWRTTPASSIRGPRDMWPLLRDLPQKDPPGARAVYNNGAYVLVGIALEILTGIDFPELARTEVLEPVGARSSGFWALDAPEHDVAVGLIPGRDGAEWRSNIYAIPAVGGPDGGAQMPVADLIALIDGVAGRGDGAGFLSGPTRVELIGPHAATADGVFRIGRGVLHVGEGPSARFGHTGEDPGASARVWTYPATGERVAVVSNVTEGAGAMTRRIDELLAGARSG